MMAGVVVLLGSVLGAVLGAPTLSVVQKAACVNNVTKFTPCGPESTSCFIPRDFSEGCESIGGAVLKGAAGTPFCVVKGAVSQVEACGGKSCYIQNFEEGCKAAGGFISGNSGNTASPHNMIPGICALRGEAQQFGPCPDGTGSCEVEPGFEDTCAKLGGFIDGYGGPPPSAPSCTVSGDYSWFRPCNASSTGGCSFSGSNFKIACNLIGGFITATADGRPVCMVAKKVAAFNGCDPDSRTGCTIDTNSFTAACAKLEGALVGSSTGAGPQDCFVAL